MIEVQVGEGATALDDVSGQGGLVGAHRDRPAAGLLGC
jgi:hypothetical protein